MWRPQAGCCILTVQRSGIQAVLPAQTLQVCGVIPVGPEEVALCLCSSLKCLQCAAGLRRASVLPTEVPAMCCRGVAMTSVGPWTVQAAPGLQSSTTASLQHFATAFARLAVLAGGCRTPPTQEPALCPAGLWHHICGRSGGHCPRELAAAASVPRAVGAHHPRCGSHDRCSLLIWCAVLGWPVPAYACLALMTPVAAGCSPSSC